jgi:transcriptional regulator with XRE-family HTH domain
MPRVTLVKLPGLIRWRIRRALTQEALADRSGCSRYNVSRIEMGGFTHPSMGKRLADALECTLDDLMQKVED